MESPTAIVKNAINPGSIVKLLVGTLVVFAILDLLSFTDWVLYPVSNAKAKWGTPAAS